MTKLLVTGGCGFIGVNFISYFGQDYENVRVLDNESLGKREHLDGLGAEFMSGDIRDRDQLRAALDGVDCVVHLAADTRVMDSIENPGLNFEANVIGTFRLLEEMRRQNVGRIVFASTGGAIVGDMPPPVHEQMMPQPASPYGASKLACEGYLSSFSQSYGLKCTALRFSNVYGPKSFHKGSVVAQFYKDILHGKPLTVYGDGSQQRDFISARDISRCINIALKSDKSGVYQLGSGKPTSLNELIEVMRGVVGPDAIDVNYLDFRKGEVRNTWCQVDYVKSELGFAPEDKLADGLKETWDWFKDQYKGQTT